MSWKDRFVKGSYRNQEFFIESHTENGGRRSQQHEFVDRDTPYTEDLGRKGKSFSVDFHLIGDDVFEQREAMVSVLNLPGAGVLVHPYLGEIEVNVDSYSYTENDTEGRIVRFSVSFLEAGSNDFPSIIEDRQQTLLDATESALVSAQARFEETFSVLQQPGFVVEAARELVNQAANAFDSATSVITDISDTATDLAFSTRNLIADSLDLVQKPAQLAARLTESMSLLASVANTAEEAKAAFSTMYNFEGGEDVVGNTEARQAEQRNLTGFNNLIRDIAIIRGVEEASDTQFNSIDEAIQEQENLSELLNRQGETAADNNINFFQDIQDVLAALVFAVPNVDNDLPNIVTVEVKDTTNTLVLAYDLFEDADQEQDIIDRNNIEHPGFVQGGETLEVLNG